MHFWRVLLAQNTHQLAYIQPPWQEGHKSVLHIKNNQILTLLQKNWWPFHWYCWQWNWWLWLLTQRTWDLWYCFIEWRGFALTKGAAFYCSCCFDCNCFAYHDHCQHCHKDPFCYHYAQSNFLLLHASQSFPDVKRDAGRRRVHLQFIGWQMVLIGVKFALFLSTSSSTWTNTIVSWHRWQRFTAQWMIATTWDRKFMKTMVFQKRFWFWTVMQQNKQRMHSSMQQHQKSAADSTGELWVSWVPIQYLKHGSLATSKWCLPLPFLIFLRSHVTNQMPCDVQHKMSQQCPAHATQRHTKEATK